MAYQSLELGTAADDGTGDSLRVGGDKINDNFVELYTTLGDGDALSSGISASSTVVSLVAPNISGVVAGTQTSATITTLSATTNINSGSTITLDATTDIILDADGGDIFFKDAGTTFGSATNTSGNLIIKSGTTTAATFSGANVTLAGTLGVGAITTTGSFKGADGYTIGNASVAAVMTLASTGIVTFADDILIKDGGTIGAASAATAITIASTGIVTFADDIIIKDGGTIGSATDVDAIAIGSDGDVTLTQDLELQHDGAILSFGANDEVTLTHVHDTGILLNSTNVIQFNDASQNIGAPTNAILDINATDEIELNATLVDINANVEISGTATTTGVHTFTAVPVFPNNTIETADIQADAITGAKIADNAINSEHYTDGSIDTAHIADNQITLAKLAGGTDGNIISYDASGDPVAIATGNDGQVLTSTGAGSPPAFEDAAGGGAYTLIGTAVASNSASLTVTGLDSTYDTFAIAISDIDAASAAVAAHLQFGDSSGVDVGSADYCYHGPNSNVAGASYGGAANNADPFIKLHGEIGNSTGDMFGAMLFLHRPGDGVGVPTISGTTVATKNVLGTQESKGGFVFGARLAVITLDRVLFKLASGNITSGRMTVWGIAHA